ncbi:MAG TPA: N-acetylmuramoyl-L-alanine amidase [Bacteroidia bacterium]|nr:N-acetylmuramoyl-L-alanine amidase [Bacteroidia bacterium]
MTTKYGFTQFTIDEFEKWLNGLSVARTILYVQQHHTAIPDYSHFTGSNHFERQQSMKTFHVVNNGWSDIAQQFTTFPDGTILTGRSMEMTPSGIKGFNTHAICIEHFGNFDKGKDTMNKAHAETMVRMTAALCKKFNIPVDSNHIVYHHWFDLGTGKRTNGTGSTKTCPGTAFFGGNTVDDCDTTFLPLVKSALKSNGGNINVPDSPPPVLRYAAVTTDSLNVRKGAGTSFDKVTDREPATLGSVLRVYKEKDGWLKISAAMNHWVNAKYTSEVKRATVKTDILNMRIGPGTNFAKKGSFAKGTELFIFAEQNGWCQVGVEEKWVSKEFLKFD